MKCNFVTCQAMLFFIIFSGVVSVHADDKPKPVKDQKPKLVKRGGVTSENLWKEEDVREYLALPYLASTNDVVSIAIDDIASKLEAVQGVGRYQLVKDKNRPFKRNDKGLNAISFEFRGEDKSALHVTVNDYQSWNSECDKLFRYITSTVALWNEIPDYYAIKKTDDIYTITRKGKKPQKWHFDLKKRIVVGVYSKTRQKNTENEEKTIADIDQVIKSLVTVIEDKKDAK